MQTAFDGAGLTTIEVNGKHFVSGLTWVALTKPHGYMDEARKIGKERKMDMVAIRKRHLNIQAGFAPKSQQKLRGMYSLAAALGGPLGENWIGVFELSTDRYAFIAVHNGAVMAGRDIVADRATVEEVFNDVYQLLSSESTTEKWTNTGTIVAPEDWDFSTDNRTLEQLLIPKDLRNDHRLRPLTLGLTLREIVAIGACIVIVAGAALGFLQWQKIKAAARTAEATAQRLALEEQVKLQQQGSIPKPWEALPEPAIFLAACQAHWESVPLSVGGWVFTKGNCSPQGAAATYNRPDQGATVSAFADAAGAAGFPSPQVYDMGTSAVFAKAFALTPSGEESLPSYTATMQGFTNLMQQSSAAAGTEFQMKESVWEAPADNPNATAPDWKTTAFEVKTTLNPARLLADMPLAGLRIREVTASLNAEDASLTWTITGDIYAR